MFQAWAEDVAGKFGYSVAFSGIGRAEEEQKVVQAPTWPHDVDDVGSATQVCSSLCMPSLTCCDVDLLHARSYQGGL